MHSETSKKTYYINSKEKNAPILLGEQLLEYLQNSGESSPLPVFVCIGSDRVTGDSLGPLVGSQLKKRLGYRFPVYGTLDSPIHALNLNEAMRCINKRHRDHTIIAIDASLGTKRHQGYISIGKGSLLPGAGVEKDLSAVGDIFITGIIGTAGHFAHLTLQTTRLSTVVNLADCMTEGILLACRYYASDFEDATDLWDFGPPSPVSPVFASTTGATLESQSYPDDI